MAKSLAELRDERASALNELEALNTEIGDDAPTAEQESKFDELDKKGDVLDSAIKRLEKVQQHELRTKAPVTSTNPQRQTDTETNSDEFSSIDVGETLKPRFADLGELALAVRKACIPNGTRDSRLEYQAAIDGAGAKYDSEGGFLMGSSISAQIWDGLNATSDNLLGMTDNYTVEGESLTFNANAETSRATGSRYGGTRGYWLAEGDQMTRTEPKWRQVKIEPHQLGVLSSVTDKLLRGSGIALGQYLTKAAVEEINFMIGDAIINGSGAGKPLGILNSGCLVSVAKDTGQAAKTITTSNIVNMWSRMSARARAGAIWLINQDIEPQLFQLSLDVGTGGLPVYMPPGGLSQAPYSTIFNRPVIATEYNATLGTVGDIILCNPKYYVTGTKGGVETALSIHLYFDYNKTAFRFLFEVDGQTWLNSAITPFKGTSNTQSPFVALASRA